MMKKDLDKCIWLSKQIDSLRLKKDELIKEINRTMLSLTNKENLDFAYLSGYITKEEYVNWELK